MNTEDFYSYLQRAGICLGTTKDKIITIFLKKARISNDDFLDIMSSINSIARILDDLRTNFDQID